MRIPYLNYEGQPAIVSGTEGDIYGEYIKYGKLKKGDQHFVIPADVFNYSPRKSVQKFLYNNKEIKNHDSYNFLIELFESESEDNLYMLVTIINEL